MILLETGDRLETLARLWHEHQDRMTYNELKGTLEFSRMRPTDYRHNKAVKVTNPLHTDDEFQCELRRRKILRTFDEYCSRQMEKPENMDKVKKEGNVNVDQDSNLTKSEMRGLKSLKKRIKAGELGRPD